jgi:hypothetical protein
MSEGEEASAEKPKRVNFQLPGGVSIVEVIKPAPSIAILKFVQGIIELIGRGVCIAVILIVFITSSFGANQSQGAGQTPIGAASAAAGWTIFIGIIGIIYEPIFIVFRFLNFGFMRMFRMIYLIVDIVFSGIIALCFFIGAISLAAGAGFAAQFIAPGNSAQDNTFLINLSASLGAASFFSFVATGGFVFLAVWMILYLVFSWDLKAANNSSSYNVEAASSEAES